MGSGASGTLVLRRDNARTDPAGSALPRVLVVEDDDGMAEVITRALGPDVFELVVANSGRLGLDLASRHEFDLVILDLLLPDLDGLSLLKRLMTVRPGQQVLVVSAMSNVEAKVSCLDMGASDYLAKPFALDELVARVGARLRVGRPEPSSRFLHEGALKLDIKRRRAVFNNRVIHLSEREFFLLEHLMRHEGEVCTRREILEAVWECTFDPGTNVVDVYVRRIRLKMPGVTIDTIRNVGYCFLVP